MTILTVNAAGFGMADPNRLKDQIRTHKVRGLVLRDNVGLANELVDEFPWLTVTYRHPWPPWHPRADDEIQEGSVDDFVTFIQGLGLHFTPDHRMRVYVGNELATNEKVANWLTTCVNAFAEERIPGDFGNWAVGNPPRETRDWVDILADYILALSQRRDLMRSGHHEYFITHPLAANFPYYVGRTTFLREAQEEIGISPEAFVREVITECGWDNPAWRTRGIPQADYLMQLAYATDTVWEPAGIEMAAVYQLGANDHSLDDKWIPYDVEDSDIPVSIFSREGTAMPDYQPVKAIPTSPQGTTVRAEPTRTGKFVDWIKVVSPPRVILAVLEPAAWVPVKRNSQGDYYPADKEGDKQDLRWIPVHITEIPADGYIREDVITLQPTQPQPPTPPVEDDWEALYKAEVEAHAQTKHELDIRTQQRDNMTWIHNQFLDYVEQLRAEQEVGWKKLLDGEPEDAQAGTDIQVDPEAVTALGEEEFKALYSQDTEPET